MLVSLLLNTYYKRTVVFPENSRFTAAECLDNAESVVEEFLELFLLNCSESSLSIRISRPVQLVKAGLTAH